MTEKSYGGERGIQRTITRFDRFGGGGGKKGEMRDLCRNWRRRKRGIAWFLLLSSCVSRIKRTLALARCVLCYGFGGSLCCSCGFLRLGKTYDDDGDDGGYAYITCLVGSLGRDTPDAFNWNTAKSKITEAVWLKKDSNVIYLFYVNTCTGSIDHDRRLGCTCMGRVGWAK